MDKTVFDIPNADIAWCPGCGNFGILNIMKKALTEMNISPRNLVFSSGIGQAAKIPQYLQCHYFNGLHGRSLPVATAIKAVNPKLTVIAESGDGCTYGEGGNHFIHTIRRNPDIVNLVHNNMIYGLTKGQGSPTTNKGMKTSLQLNGYPLEPFNPIATALSCGATFIARAFSGDVKGSVEILKKAVEHKGYAIIDMLQPCVTFNKLNTYKWFKENTYSINDNTDKKRAFEISMEQESLALGVIYKGKETESFTERTGIYESNKRPLAYTPE